MNKIFLSIIGLLIVGVVAVPVVVKKQVEAQIENEKQILKDSGIELTLTKEEGYISSFREFEMKIVNGKKFRDYIFTKFAEKNSNYKGLTELFQKQSDRDIRPALDGTTFYGTLRNSNLLISSPVIEISLTKFSDEIMSSFDGDSDVDKLAHSILDEKIFTFFIILDSNQKISHIIMQDIDKEIIDKNDIINVKLKNHTLDIDIKESLKGVYTLGEQLIKAKKFLLNTKGVKYKFDYLAQFENKGNLHVDSFEIKENKGTIKVGNIDISNSVKISKDNALSGDVKYSVKDVYYKEREKFELDALVFSIAVFGVDKDAIVDASNAYNEITFQPKQNSIKVLTDSLQKILNRGFKVDVIASLSGLSSSKMTLDNSDFILNLNVEPNKYTIKSNDIINAVLIEGKLTLDEKNINDIVKMDKSLARFAKLGKKDGSKMVFNYEFKQGILLINGNKL